MTETPPKFTINDFPTELIERFVPDRRPTTISSLKLVSKRFYHGFSYDYYYKSYLRFPEKHYLCEAKCEKNSGKQVFKDIESGSVGKWKGYLTIENIHLKNWSEGKITHTEIVPLPNSVDGYSSYNASWQELIDENSEHWLLNVRNDRAIVLLNITDEPKMLVYPKMDTGAHKIVVLLSGQVICLNYSSSSYIRVLDIVYDGDVVLLQYKFTFEINSHYLVSWTFVSGKSESDGSYKNMFVYGLSDSSGIFHFRDLKTDNMLENVCLRDYEYLDRCAISDNAYFKLMKNEGLTSNQTFPFIVVTIGLFDIHNSMMSVIYNVDKMQVTTFVNVPSPDLNECYISCNVAYIFSSNYFDDVLHVFRVSLERSCENMEKPTIPDRLCRISTRSSSIILSKHLKFAYKGYSNKVHIVSITDLGVSDVEVYLDMNVCFEILGVIGPDILIIKTDGQSKNVIAYKIPKEGGGLCEKVIDWGRVVAGNETHCHALPVTLACQNTLGLISYSKLVLSYENPKNSECLAIVHF